MSYLYILDTDSLVIPFANIFFFGRLSFHFVDSLFCCEKDFKFNLVPFVYFLFLFHCLRRQVQKCIATICVKEYFMFSSRSCMVSGLTFMSLTHFEFIFIYALRKQSSQNLLHDAVFPKLLVEEAVLSLHSINSCILCQRLIDHITLGPFCSIDLCVLFCASNTVLVTIA